MSQEFKEIKEHIQQKFPAEKSKLQKYLEENKLFIFLLTKKMVGKSVYSQYLKEIFPEYFAILSFGQAVRNLQQELQEAPRKVKDKWGPKTVQALKQSSVKKLLPLPVVEKIFENLIQQASQEKSILFDGIPRKKEQIPLVLNQARRLTKEGFQVIFLEIDLADAILDQRLTSRRVCPQCQFTDNILTPSIENFCYEDSTDKYYLICPHCQIKMKPKKGDRPSPAIYHRRRKFEDVASLLKKRNELYPFIYLRMDMPTKEFQGKPEEINQIVELNHYENGTVYTERKPQVGENDGEKIYSLSPRAGLARIIKTLNETL